MIGSGIQIITDCYSQLVGWFSSHNETRQDEIEIPAIIFSNTTSPSSNVKKIDVSLSSLITYLAKKIFALGCFAALVNNSPYFALPIGFLIGLSSPEFVMEKTTRIYAGIFQPKEVKIKCNQRIPDICLKVIEGFYSFKPAIITGTIAFFALPVSTFPIITALVALRLGAYVGMSGDTTRYKDQWLYTEIS